MEELTELIHQAQAGSTEAYSALVGRFQNMAYGYAYAVLGDFDQAQDAAQEAFIEAYRYLPDLRQPLAFPAWLKRIVFKHCDRITRRTRRETSLEGALALASTQPGPPEIAERRESDRRVRTAIQSMSPDQRAVTALFYISGYSLQEIADFLEVPAQTVKSRLHAARKRLRERMLDMVQDEFNHNTLPEGFTHETVEQAVKQAAELNRNSQFGEAESLLRRALAQSPGHPSVLKELNRSLMRGKVYAQGRWDLLHELAKQGQVILRAGADEEVYRQVAQTLLAVPAMREAAGFIEDWIAVKGPNLERLGMLAWATGCQGDFDKAYAQWQEVLHLVKNLPNDDMLARLPFIAYTLVDCLAAAGEKTRAAEIAQQVWNLCGGMGPLPAQETFNGDNDWLLLWRTAEMDPNEIAPTLLARHSGDDPDEQAVSIAIRAWFNLPETVTADSMSWAGERIQAGEYQKLEKVRLPVLMGLRSRGLWREANRMAQAIWQRLGDAGAEAHQRAWSWERFNPMGAVEVGDWSTAMAIVREEISARSVKGAIGWAAIVFGGAGEPTPPVIVQALISEGVEVVDEYGMFGWYILAREAASAGHEAEAFNALQKALEYWTNPPYFASNLWEQDAIWGPLRESPEFKAAFDARRARIGPIYGLLHYFPGW
jgi:RNA polymerase sigma factor (sigma-70 family)